MAKVQTAHLEGLLVFEGDETQGHWYIDGYSVLEVLTQMEGQKVHFEIVSYQESKTTPPPEAGPPPPPDDIVKRLMEQ